MTGIVVQGVSVKYGDRAVLSGICLSCNPGEIVGLVGRSGSGKTSLLNAISGFLPCASGSVSIHGAPPRTAARQQQIGFIFQAPTLMPWLTARQNVELPLRLLASQEQGLMSPLNGLLSAQASDAVANAMANAHIEDAADKYPDELSGGMQTRVSIARAIVYKPSVILADEPFAALDDVVKESIYSDLQSIIISKSISAIVVTHNLSEAVLLCDRIYVLGDATQIAGNTISAVIDVPLRRPRTPDVFGDNAFLDARRKLREALE